MADGYQDLDVERDGDVAIVRLARPEHKNAVRLETLEELASAFEALNGDPSVRAIVLAGRGDHFCAGADFQFLAEGRTLPPLMIQDIVYAKAQAAAKGLYGARKPTVAAINGAAITVGCELALCCDFRILSETGFFQEVWIRVGTLPPLGGLFLLPRIVGLGRAAELVLRGRRVAAAEALAWGLATEVVAPDGLLPRAVDLARELAALPPQAYRLAKLGLHRGLGSTMDQELTANALAQALLVASDDFQEGLAAAVARRPGVFHGR